MKRTIWTKNDFLWRCLIITTLVGGLIGLLTIYNCQRYIIGFIFELLFITTISCFVWRGRLIIQLFGAFILSAQVTSLVAIGIYLPSLVFSNLATPQVLGTFMLLKISLLVVLCYALFIYVMQQLTSFLHYQRYQVQFGILILSTTLIIGNFIWGNKTPTVAFIDSFSQYLSAVLYKATEAEKYVQKKIYNKVYVYQEKNTNIDVPNLSNYNIIVFFTEGFSSFEIGKNNLKYIDTTPNINKLMEESISFENYFNHTAATFRGLRGQLSSSYQRTGGYYNNGTGFGEIDEKSVKKKMKNTLISMIDILNDNGYNTYFLSSHPNSMQLNMMLKRMNFKKVIGSNWIKDDNSDFTDQEIYAQLTDLVINNKLKEPYFIGIYNIGTHLGVDSPDEKWKKGKNIYLNTVYNLDNAFGKFWQKFQNSQARKNTIFILTADHAAFPSQILQNTYHLQGEDAVTFANKIPLVINYQEVKPQSYDAHGRNSLDFAPTVLHLLRIKNAENYFLGCSLFENSCPNDFEYYTNYDNEFFTTKNNKIERIEPIQKIKDFYALSENK